MAPGIMAQSAIECVVNISGECPLVVIAGGLEIPRWAIPPLLFLLMAREVWTCTDSLEFLKSIPRRAANLLAARRRIGVLRRQNRHLHDYENGVKTGASAAVLTRR